MKNVIQLLEKIGQTATLEKSDRAQLEKMLVNAEIDEASKAAILEADVDSLAELLDTRQKIVAFLAPAEDEDEDAEDDGKEEICSNDEAISG